MKHSINLLNAFSQQSSQTFTINMDSIMNSQNKSLQASISESKFKHLSDLVSRRDKNAQLRSSQQKGVQNFIMRNNHLKCGVMTKEINLRSNDTCAKADTPLNSLTSRNSKTKLHISMKKQPQQTQKTLLNNANSIRSISSSLKKQKISLLSKIQSHNINSFESVNGKNSQNMQTLRNRDENKQNLGIYSSNTYHKNEFNKVVDPTINKLMLDKINEKKTIFSSRPLKTTREIIQMKEGKEKQKIKIKLQKTSKPLKQSIRI